MSNITIPDISGQIMSGFQQRFQQQFGCDIVIAQTEDEVMQLLQRNRTRRLQYPYAYARKISVSSPTDGDWYSRFLFRNGIPIKANATGNARHNMRLMPAHTNLTITYVTNRFEGANSVEFFVRRWLFCARNGGLKFAIRVGNLRLMIGNIMSLDVPMPTRGNVTQEASSYKLEADCTVRGFVSETQMKQVGILNEIQIETIAKEGFSSDAVTWKYPTLDLKD